MIGRRTRVMGLDIKPTFKNAKKFAADLAQLQARALTQTDKLDYLDQDPHPGHLNFELNKFGVALSAAIKQDLRQHPRTALLDFYVTVMAFAVDMKHYEIAARVYKGITDASTRDHVDYGCDVYELPKLDAETETLLIKIKQKLNGIKLWENMRNIEFPNPDKSRSLYQQHMKDEVKFIPLIQSLLGMIAYSLEKAKVCFDTDLLSSEKEFKLLQYKADICRDLFLIEHIIRSCLPLVNLQELHFPALMSKFEDELCVRVEAVPSCHQDEALHKMLKLDVVTALLDLDVKVGGRVSQSTFRMSFFARADDAATVQHGRVHSCNSNNEAMYRGDMDAETESGSGSEKECYSDESDEVVLSEFSPRNNH